MIDWLVREIVPCWPMVAAFTVAGVGILVVVIVEILGSRPPRGGYAGEEEITRHRLQEHHHFDF